MGYWQTRRVLVTGGAGFIGSYLVELLVHLGARVRVADNMERGSAQHLADVRSEIELLTLDLRDADSATNACDGMDVVFHLASKVGGIGYYLRQPAEVLTHNTLIDTQVLLAARKAGVGRYLYASSAHVYPIELQVSKDAPLIHEDQAIPAHPELSYGWAKLLGEQQIAAMAAEQPAPRAAIVRLIGVYGPRQDLDLATGSAIPVFTRRAIEYPARAPFVLLGTGVETRSYCYVSDVTDALVRTIEALESQPLIGPLNIGSEARISILDLAQQIVQISGKEIPIQLDASHPTTIWGQALDCSRARAVLDGWRPRVTLADGLARTYASIERRLAGADTALASSPA